MTICTRSVRLVLAVVGSGILLVAGCSAPASPGGGGRSGTSGRDSVGRSGTDAGTVALPSGGRVAYRCDGAGVPAMLLEAGTDSAGTTAFPAAFTRPLAALTRVCTYDRPGTGSSDPAPRRRRTMTDLCAVEDDVIARLGLGEPYVLVGASGGGNLAIGCAAARRPGQVAGVAMIDSYHDDPADLAGEGLVWTDNHEFVDYVDQARRLDGLRGPAGAFHLLVFSATQADPGGPENQAHWLGLTAHSRQVVVAGGHDLPSLSPGPLVAGLTALLADLRH